MSETATRRLTLSHHGLLPASPEAVFPLLCPQRELDWLADWRYRMLYSRSGLAEDGCVFTTDHDGPATWVVSRFEPPRRIEFTIFSPQRWVCRLTVRLEPTRDGATGITWQRTYTALSAAGEAHLTTLDQRGFDVRIEDLDRQLAHYLEHGTMVRDGHGLFRH